MQDSELLAAFENGEIPEKQWNHRAHVRVAYLYASQSDIHDATGRMRAGIQNLNAAHQSPGQPHQGYHETITQAFMWLIHRKIAQSGRTADSGSFCDRHPELLDARVLLCYYTRDRIMSAEARLAFVPPDLTSLDQVGLAYPEFGDRQANASYRMRPGAYGVIRDHAQQIAMVATPTGWHLPGGGQEEGEPALQALHREVMEECGLTIRVTGPLGMADEFVFDEEEQQYYQKRCTFYAAEANTLVAGGETDHRLVWTTREKALEQLTHASQRWAVGQASFNPGSQEQR